MGKLRVEFLSELQSTRPILSTVLTVDVAPTGDADRPVAPANRPFSIPARLTALDAPMYVDIGPTPDPMEDPRTLVLRGQSVVATFQPGDKLSAVLTTDLPPDVNAPAIGVTDISIPGRGFSMVVTQAGNVDITFIDGSLMPSVPFDVGTYDRTYSVINIQPSAANPATFVAWGLR